jgi:hypothetical protein
VENKNLRDGLIFTGVLLTLLAVFIVWQAIDNFAPPSNEKRYEDINEVKNKLDYDIFGEVIEEHYDKNGRGYTPSYFLAKIKGEDAFRDLGGALKLLPEVNCEPSRAEEIKCRIDSVDVTITEIVESENVVELKISDDYNGRG